jgi:hypothetical protein
MRLSYLDLHVFNKNQVVFQLALSRISYHHCIVYPARQGKQSVGKISEAETVLSSENGSGEATSGPESGQSLSKTGKGARPPRKKRKKLKLRTIILLVVIVLLLGGGGYGVYKLFFYEAPVEIMTGTTVRDSITTVIEGSAVTSPTSFQMLTIPSRGP